MRPGFFALDRTEVDVFMPMDGLTLGALARELNRVLEGGRVDRVQQPERDELLLTLRAQGGGVGIG